MTSAADAPQPTDLERLAAYAQSRGYRRWVAAAIAVVGCIPAVIVASVRRPGLEDVPLIGALFVFVPAALLFLWTYRDRAGRAAREIAMWVRAITRATSDDDASVPIRELPEVPAAEEIDRVSLPGMANDYRESLAPLVSNQGLLHLRIAIIRYWYVVAWAVSSTALVMGYLAIAPR